MGNKRRWSKVATGHLNILLLVFFGVYAYRDLYPLATFGGSPRDAAEGWVMGAKILLLFLVAIAYPLVVPGQYVPVDPLVNKSSISLPQANKSSASEPHVYSKS